MSNPSGENTLINAESLLGGELVGVKSTSWWRFRLTTSSPPFFLSDSRGRETRARVKITLLPLLAWCDFHARSCFALSTISEEKWGTTRSLGNSLVAR